MPARSLQWDPAPDGHRRVSLEAALVVYDREGKAVNWMLRQINLNPDAAHYTLAQGTGSTFISRSMPPIRRLRCEAASTTSTPTLQERWEYR